MDIGVIGAGAASAAAAYAIHRDAPDAHCTVLEKSGGVCGRAATRRRDGTYYDYGANYLKDDDERIVSLVTERLESDGLVSVDGPIHVFDEDGTVGEGRQTDERKLTYRTGITQLAKRLFAETDATVNRHTRITGISRDGDQWLLTDADGDRWGPYDRLLCTPPAPQTARLVREADWDDDRRASIAEAAEAVEYRTILTAVLGYEFALEVPYYALVNTDKRHEIGWIAREECKPGHVPDGESVLIVQANDRWSVERYDDDPTDTVAELARLTADVVGDARLETPAWTDYQGWRYAQPERGVDRDAVESAERDGLYCLGDWVAGEGRLHAALRNGLETGERVARSLEAGD
ncbi:NAD(P)/FAD-dependent oxidoreductase [Natrarchaeobius chitinivorans]|uniref:NAD/FAD-dependent oxidoreductase n=1 Tax=Natrarchaeobius chitinivorans TaxID=1679083 RepID=A0A3N6LZ68_NATCH|nr:FAD-dependent oxidoreductase [Natrarchaeobius chitinivorans]RQG94457.1 NAD/FAD-dependent oxidoreductase [Natrarchaeobius chitinivorans]